MNKFMKKAVLVLVLTFSLVLLVSCKETPEEEKYHNYTLNLDDSFNTINVVTIFTLGETSQEELDELYNELNNILIELDNLFNIQLRKNNTNKTQLMQINENAGLEPVEVSDEVIFVIKKAIEISEKTIVDGKALFDPTIAPVWQLWGFTDPYNPLSDNRVTIPSEETINENIALVDYTKIVIDEENNTVFLTEKGMKLDLGSIVKGYAADKLKKHLIEKGYTKAVVDVGRNILTVGSYFNSEKEDQPWTVKLQTPFKSQFYDSEDIIYYGKLYVTDKTIVTSGTYEKYVMDDEGRKYHHILDPRTGYPFDNGVLSVTVITSESILGDGYSTALFSLGLDEGMKIVNDNDNIDAVWVIQKDNKKEVYISNGLYNNFNYNTNVDRIGYVFKGVYNENTTN